MDLDPLWEDGWLVTKLIDRARHRLWLLRRRLVHRYIPAEWDGVPGPVTRSFD